MFEAVQRWVSYVSSDSDITPAERQVACPRLLNHVRLPQLSPEYIMSKVSKTCVFKFVCIFRVSDQYIPMFASSVMLDLAKLTTKT